MAQNPIEISAVIDHLHAMEKKPDDSDTIIAHLRTMVQNSKFCTIITGMEKPPDNLHAIITNTVQNPLDLRAVIFGKISYLALILSHVKAEMEAVTMQLQVTEPSVQYLKQLEEKVRGDKLAFGKANLYLTQYLETKLTALMYSDPPPSEASIKSLEDSHWKIDIIMKYRTDIYNVRQAVQDQLTDRISAIEHPSLEAMSDDYDSSEDGFLSDEPDE